MSILVINVTKANQNFQRWHKIFKTNRYDPGSVYLRINI
jgi:hypothetical protein